MITRKFAATNSLTSYSIKIEMDPNYDYMTPYHKFFAVCDDYDKNYATILDEIAGTESTVALLSTAKRCLVIGPGSGMYEIAFVQRLLPKLEVLTAVEQDKTSADELKNNLRRHLPNVACKVHEIPCHQLAENGFGSGQPYDVVTIFHVLYHVTSEQRKLLFDALYGHLLSPTGVVLVGHASQCDLPDSRLNIVKRLSPVESATITDTDIQSEMEKAGFRVVAKNELGFRCDMSDINQALTDFFSIWAGRTVTPQELNDAVRKVWPSGVTEKNYVIFMWLQK